MNIFKKIKKKILRFRLVLIRNMRILPDKVYVEYLYNYYTGKNLSLENPIEFNEKIQWYKIYFRPKILNSLVDKNDVRAYVKEKIGSAYLNEVYGVYYKPEDINFDDLPKQYVIKATNASSYNLIVKDKDLLDIKKTRKLLKKWLVKSRRYYLRSREWPYKDIEPRFIIEKFLKEHGQNSLIDYKFYCFNGTVEFVEVHLDRASKHKRAFYDLNFNKLEFRYVSIENSISIELQKPLNFEEMIQLSANLSKGLPFVRVDFYSINGKSIFGELTFYPSGGRKDFYPKKYNKIIGDYFVLPKLNENQKTITKI